MRLLSNGRRAKINQDGNFLKNLVSPGAGKTGLFGMLSTGLGAAAEYKKMKELPKLQAQALDLDVQAKKDLLERAATTPEMSRLGLDKLQRDVEKSEERDASDLATLIEQGMTPEQATQAMDERKTAREDKITGALQQADALENQLAMQTKTASDAAFGDLVAAQTAADQFDLLGQKQADIEGLFSFGTQAANAEGLFNPQAAKDATEKTRGAKLAERGYKHGGITPGPHDHDVLNLIISHEDGTPALDNDGDEMHVTGSEAIIPDYIFEELMAAAKAGDKNALFEIFMDEIATEERFQV